MLVKSESEESDPSASAFINLPSTPSVCESLGAPKSHGMTVQITTVALRDPAADMNVSNTDARAWNAISYFAVKSNGCIILKFKVQGGTLTKGELSWRLIGL
jgi:hypothetical protein